MSSLFFAFVLLLQRLPAEVTFAQSESYVQQAAVGEGVDGFPNWQERLIHQWINRARVDPQAELKDCTGCADAPCYRPVPPLAWSESLNRSARFHADEMRLQGYFGHESRCLIVANIAKIYPSTCDGAADCACKEPGTMAFSTRIGLFGAIASGEVLALAPSAHSAFYVWLLEPAQISTCQFNSANGHRWLMLKSAGAVGVGASGYFVSDFGGGQTPLKIVSGSHYPRQAEQVELWANWYDFAPPRSASVVVDGKCIPMMLRRGSPQSGAYLATVSGVGSGCHRYYFVFTDAAGNSFTYPSTGSLGIGSGTSCPDWNGSRVSSTCSTPTGSRRRLTRRP